MIRGNISEIKALGIGTGTTKGVDADAADAVTEENLDSMIRFVKGYAGSTGSVIAVTGAIDLVADSKRCFVIRNGKPQMGKITGTGCQLSGMMTVYHRQSGQCAGGSGCRSMCHGACGRDRIFAFSGT